MGGQYVTSPDPQDDSGSVLTIPGDPDQITILPDSRDGPTTAGGPVELGDEVLGPTFSAESRKAVSRAESNVQGMTLLLASPDFQRR